MADPGRGPKTPLKLLRKCSVHTCYYSDPRYGTENNIVAFFRLPKEEFRAKLWLKALGRKSKYPRIEVCETHFTKDCISIKNLRTRLIATAVPTLHLAPAPAPAASRRAAQTCEPEPRVKLELPDHDYIPEIDIFVKEETVVSRKRTYEEMVPDASSLPDCYIKVERLDERYASVASPERETGRSDAESIEPIDSGNGPLEPELVKYREVKALMRALRRGGRVDGDLSLFALKLYHSFPQTYRVMQIPLGLPSTIHMRTSFRSLRGEGTPLWVRLLRARFSGAAAAARACVVCVLRAPLRPALAYDAARDRLCGLLAGQPARDRLCGLPAGQPARHAALLLARGLHQRWRQPLACRLLPARYDVAELRRWITDVIAELFRIGLDVRAFVTDFDDRFAPTGPIVTAERPYFAVDGHQIYCFYDVTQLMVSFRNHLMAYDVTLAGMTATWGDIEEMHEYNSTRAYPLVTGLTAEHVRPPARGAAGSAGAARQRARLATETLARPVAAALAAAVELRVLADGAHGTVQLVAALADLYAALHDKELGRDSTVDVRFLNEMIARLERTALVSRADRQPVRDPGLLAALRAGVHAALALHERMRRAGATLPMRVMNNDPLHEFFDLARARDGHRPPTARGTLAAFRRSFAFNATKPLRSSPEAGRFEEFLTAASEARAVPRAGPTPARVAGARLEGWVARLRLARGRRAAPGLARALLAGCLARHGGCAAARAFCAGSRLPAALLRHVEALSLLFAAQLAAAAAPGAGLLATLLARAAGDPFAAPCPCFPTRELQAMFFRFKIRALIDFNNNRLRRDPSAELALPPPVDVRD